MSDRRIGAGAGRRITVQVSAECLAFGVGHEDELHRHVVHSAQGGHRPLDRAGDLRLKGTTRNCERNLDADRRPGHRDFAHHAQFDDASPQLRVLDRSQGLDHLGLADRHKTPQNKGPRSGPEAGRAVLQ